MPRSDSLISCLRRCLRRTNAYCGVTCEPGMLFFPCNNHPHYALKIFGKLGHGDWTDDARRWERWANEHFLSPFFGGGAINLFYSVDKGMGEEVKS